MEEAVERLKEIDRIPPKRIISRFWRQESEAAFRISSWSRRRWKA